MEVYEKLVKQIPETKYLATEKSYIYRPIMRCFYRHYEQLDYWLYKEDIFEELKDYYLFQNYTIEECERDLETLTEWMSLSRMYDTKNATSIEEFKYKRFRYQLTEYATEIERLTILLEEMEIKTSSLEPKLFDRLRITISKLQNIVDYSNEDVNELWNDLNNDFTKLNQNYQDFLKKFNDPKTEELIQSVIFLKFKNDMIKYLREFIKGYQKNIYQIKDNIFMLNNELKDVFLNKLNDYYKSTPIFNQNFDYQHLKEENEKKLSNIFRWFVGTNSKSSEGEKLITTTNNIIVTITKYASSLVELRGNMTSRKEEYKHLCKLFDKLDSVNYSFDSIFMSIKKHIERINVIKSLLEQEEKVLLESESSRKEYEALTKEYKNIEIEIDN